MPIRYQRDSAYYIRSLVELNNEFNFLWEEEMLMPEPVEPIFIDHLPGAIEERKQEQPGFDPEQDLDVEGAKLAQESKILKDIYGAKVTQRVIWLFEQPVEMYEQRPLGVLGSPNKVLKGGQNPFGRPPHFGGLRMPGYYDEEEDEMDEGVLKYEMIGRRRF